MKIRIFAGFAVLVMFAGLAGGVATGGASANGKVSRLVSLLPASDGVAVFDSKRFFNDALPRVLSANQPLLAEVTAKLGEIEAKTGIDLRKFDQMAVGVNIKPGSAGRMDVDTVALASGEINAGALLAVAKLASKGTYREEKAGGRSVYVFSAKDVAGKNIKPHNSKIAGVIEDVLGHLTREVAVSAIDTNTLVLGPLSRVRETLEGKSRLSSDIVSLLPARGSAVVSFAVKPVGGLSRFLPLDNDELGKNVDAIQYLSGSLEVAATGATVQLMARTRRTEQAQGLKDTLEGLQVIGNAFLGMAKGADKQVYGRLVKNAKIDLRGSDVTLDLLVPQSDIDVLIGVR